MNDDQVTGAEVMRRLQRVETKLVRGFEELGVNIDVDTKWLTVNNQTHTVYVTSLGRSMLVLLTDMVRAGATVDTSYTVVFRGDVVGTIVCRRVA